MPERARRSRLVEGRGELPRPFPADGAADSAKRAEATPSPDPVEEAYGRGRVEGFSAGQEQALESFRAEAVAMHAELAATLDRLASLEERIVAESRSRMIELALEAASKIVRARVEDGDPVAGRALAEAVEALPSGSRLTAHVHPEDLEPIRQALDPSPTRERIELVTDGSISRGGCRVVARGGTIDATLETATNAIRDAAEGGGENQ